MANGQANGGGSGGGFMGYFGGGSGSGGKNLLVALRPNDIFRQPKNTQGEIRAVLLFSLKERTRGFASLAWVSVVARFAVGWGVSATSLPLPSFARASHNQNPLFQLSNSKYYLHQLSFPPPPLPRRTTFPPEV
jgi:hypothetical protein